MQRVLDVARQLAAPCELGELLAQIIDVGRDVLTADRGSVFLYDDETRELFSKIAVGEENEIRFSVDKGIAGECARTRTTVNVPDCYADPRFNRAIDIETGYRTRSSLTVPLIGLEDKLVGVLQLLNPDAPFFNDEAEMIAEALASQAAVAIQRARLLDERLVKVKLEYDLDMARQIQIGVLPQEIPPCNGYDIAVFSRPADETGGDIYDLVPLGNDAGCNDAGVNVASSPLLILLADATGHGISAALSVTQSRAMLRMGLKFSHDLKPLLANINSQLNDDLAANRFITAFIGVLDPNRHVVDYHAAGQGPMLHYRAADGHCAFFNASTVPLGIMEDLDLDAPPSIALAPGDLFVLLTDGFYEYQNHADDQFGDERVGNVIAGASAGSAQKILDTLIEATLRFAEGAPQQDDLTAVIVKRVAGE
jgi:sigma-B regulation protein RsbU (phosphoserine phosphatase)